MSSDYITKKDLEEFGTRFEERLGNRLEKKLGDSLEKRIDDKISKRLTESFNAFRVEIQHMFQVQNEHWERRFQTFESRIYTLVDPILKEIETREQDRAMTASQFADHEKRITKLEHTK